jgi:hypothetical protein
VRKLFGGWSDVLCVLAYAYGRRRWGCSALLLLGCGQGRPDEASQFRGVAFAATHPGDKALDVAPTDVDHRIRGLPQPRTSR